MNLAIRKHPEFVQGVKDFMPAALGIGAWGVMTGVAIVKSHMHWIEMLAMSIFVFAGSSQLAALPLIASGAPLLVIFATAFCVNLRFVVFSLHLRQYIMHRPLRDRLLLGYLTADMSYVMLVKRYPYVPTDPEGIAALEAYWFGIGWTSWATWGGSTLVGVVLGNAVPPGWGLAFAGILALVAVAMSLVTSRLRLVSAGVAGCAAIAAYAMPLKLNILVAIAAAVAICLTLDQANRLHARATR
jgi:predicted branched-subunit amino acid permease